MKLETKQKVKIIFFMCVVGTCMHFVCDLLPDGLVRSVFGIVFPINETSWEHMKMIWIPFLVTGAVLSIKNKSIGFLSGFVTAGIISMLMMLGVFVFYQSFIGTSILIFDIIFYMSDMVICAMLAFLLSTREWASKTGILWLVVAIAITAGIIYLTFYPGGGYVFLDDEGLKLMK